METIEGPLHGFYLACYTVEDRGAFYAYAKICEKRPESVWEAAAEKKIAVGPVLREEDALAQVISVATSRLRQREMLFSRTLPLLRPRDDRS